MSLTHFSIRFSRFSHFSITASKPGETAYAMENHIIGHERDIIHLHKRIHTDKRHPFQLKRPKNDIVHKNEMNFCFIFLTCAVAYFENHGNIILSRFSHILHSSRVKML